MSPVYSQRLQLTKFTPQLNSQVVLLSRLNLNDNELESLPEVGGRNLVKSLPGYGYEVDG